ncbi:MAG: hypothetical protein EOO88_01000 [Pedobacter sp.]|nr:MAG: hypothetical protein EOO88_01000 [Pedobacter sp.]
MKKFILAVFITFSLSACKKGPKNEMPTVGTQKLVSTRTINPNGHYILETHGYNIKGQLIKETSLDEQTGLHLFQEYIYQNDLITSSIISSDTRKLAKIVYTYADNRLTRMDFLEYGTQDQLTLNFSKSLEYNAGVLKKATTLSVQNLPIGHEEFSILDGNLLAVRSYASDGTIQNLTEYLHDMEKNPYKGNMERNLNVLGLSNNNVTRVRYTDYANPANNRDQRYEYEYNAEKFPIKKSLIGATAKELQITYAYKNF